MSLDPQQQIRVLHVDDEPDFTDLTGAFLERDDDRFTVETATSADEGLERIGDNPPDCVVSDYNMPGMDGLEFLQAVREAYPDLPFILFTGKGSEEVASDAIAADVTDYLQKGSGTSKYTVLANRISNAVEATRSAAKAEQRRHRLEQILKTVPGCVVQLNVDGQFVFANERAEEVLGLESDKLTHRTYNDPEWELQTLNGEPIPDEELPFRQVCDTGEPIYNAKHTVTWPDGTRKLLSVNAAPLFDETGDVESVIASLNDITDRRERQRELRLLQRGIEDAADGIAIIDDEGEYVYVDRSHVDMYGFDDKDELLGNTWRKLYDDDEIERLEQEAFPALEADGHWRGMVTGSRPDGSTFPAELSLTVVEDGRVVCTVRNETERRQRERRFQALVEESNDIISIVDSDGRYQYQSPSVERILGYDPESTIGDKAWEYIHPDDRERVLAAFKTWADNSSRTSEAIEYRARHADGSWRWMEAEGNDQFDNPAVEGNVINSRDITDRRERQRELGLLQQAIDDANVPITLADPSQADEPLVYVNDAFEETTGYSPEETLGRNCRFLQGEDTDPEKVAALREAVDNEEQISVELCNYRKDGTEFWNRLTITPIYDDDELVRYLGTQEDITERKKREQELDSERRFVQQTLDALDDIFYMVDTDGRLQRWNATAPEVTGYTESELDGMPAIELFPEDEHETLGTSRETVLADEQDTVEADVLTAGGQRVPYEFTGARLADGDGDTVGVVGIGRNITARRETGASVDWHRTVIRAMPGGVYVLDADYEFQFVDHRAVDAEDLSEQNWTDRQLSHLVETDTLSPDKLEQVRDGVDRVVDTETDRVRIEVEPERPESAGVTELTLSRLDVGTDNEHVLVTTRDITQYKQREREALELKRQYQTLAENLPNGAVFLFDDNIRYVRARGAELEAAGISPDEIEGATPHDIFPEETAEELARYFTDALDGTSHTFTQTLGDDTYRNRTVPVQTDTEAVTYGMALSQNVTDQAERRAELKRQNERLEEFTSIVSHDLRSPLSVAAGNLELAQDACESEHLAQAADALERSQDLIDNLLRVARGGRRVTDVETLELADVVSASWQTVETDRAALDADVSQAIQANESRLRQLFENLYRNAVEHGGDDVTVSVGAMDGGFYVADTGPGIPESDREDVFEAGYSTNQDGTGFGLQVVKQSADAHEWEIDITESKQGGARFEFTGVEFVDC